MTTDSVSREGIGRHFSLPASQDLFKGILCFILSGLGGGVKILSNSSDGRIQRMLGSDHNGLINEFSWGILKFSFWFSRLINGK
jgi:hypothetical protein